MYIFFFLLLFICIEFMYFFFFLQFLFSNAPMDPVGRKLLACGHGAEERRRNIEPRRRLQEFGFRIRHDRLHGGRLFTVAIARRADHDVRPKPEQYRHKTFRFRAVQRPRYIILDEESV